MNAQDQKTMMDFFSEFGRTYLASGGPTSRLEEYLTSLAQTEGNIAQVFATPTGIFVTLTNQNGTSETRLTRIKESSMNLGKLCWLESIFSDLEKKKISISQGLKILENKIFNRPTYSRFQCALASFLGGFALSLPNYGRTQAAFASGFIATTTWWISGPGLAKKVQSSIFRDFIGCFVALLLAGVAQLYLHGPLESFAIGALIVLVPGLALTSAISELADQNLVSGTAKLMQAMLTLLALGVAYLLFFELLKHLGIHASFESDSSALSLSASAVGAMSGVTCFAVMFGVPPKALPGATLTGLVGWIVFHSFDSQKLMAMPPFAASFAVGFLSLSLSQIFKIPSQTFSVPGILAMLPGMLALASFRTLALGNENTGVELGFRVLTTAGAIVFGLFAARIPFTIWKTAPKTFKAKT